MKIVMAIVLAGLMAAGCASGQPATPNPSTSGSMPGTSAGSGASTPATGSGTTSKASVPAYGKSDTAISTEVGRFFMIALDTNPSTGFSWTYQQVGNNLVLSDKSIIPPASGSAGAGEQIVFTFEAKISGATYLDFTYARSTPGPDDTKIRYDVKIA